MLRQSLLGTRFGTIALKIRDKYHLFFAKIERIGTISNDQLASALLARLCRPSMTFVDVGAHIGSVISEVERRDKTIKIHAVEAVPNKASKLRKKFPKVIVHETAVGETEGEVGFYINLKQAGYSSLANHAGSRKITVPLTRLDNIILSDDVDVIKIDVEGAELGVLRGCEQIIRRSRPTFLFESGARDVLGYTKHDLFTWFADHDYGIFIPNRLAHKAPPLTLDCFLDAHAYPARTTNYFAVARERFDETRALAKKIISFL